VVEDELEELEELDELELDEEPGEPDDDELVVVLEEELVGSGSLGVVIDDEDDVLGAHDSLSEAIVPWTGRLSAETGVPAGTFTLKV
jgi:hypothetical protein